MIEMKKIIMLELIFLTLCVVLVPVVGAESVVRELPSSVELGDEFNVDLTIDGIKIGAVMETIPEGFTYVSCSCPEEQVKIDRQNLTIPIINIQEISYTLRADKAGVFIFTGIWDNALNETDGTTVMSNIRVIQSGCNDGDDDYSSTSAGSISTSSEGLVSDSAKIHSKNGKAQIIIATGTSALTKSGNALQDINIEPVNSGDIPAAGSGAEYSFANQSYKCSPAGATFDPPVKLLFNLTGDEWNCTDDDREFVIRWFNESTNAWEDLPTSVDKDKHTVTARVSHFSIYALFEKTVAKTTGDKSKQEIVTAEPTKADGASSGQVAATATENPDERVTAAATGTVPQNEKSSGNSLLLFAGILIVLGIVGGAIYLSSVKEGRNGKQ